MSSVEVELHKDDVDTYNMFCECVNSDEMRHFIRGVLENERAKGHPLPKWTGKGRTELTNGGDVTCTQAQ